LQSASSFYTDTLTEMPGGPVNVSVASQVEAFLCDKSIDRGQMPQIVSGDVGKSMSDDGTNTTESNTAGYQ
jgi:hypothetical protein